MDAKIYKTSFNLSARDFKLLDELAHANHVTKADIVRQALSNFKFIEEIRNSGGSILIEDKDKKINKVIFR
jgi:predicted transcriptional regulator